MPLVVVLSVPVSLPRVTPDPGGLMVAALIPRHGGLINAAGEREH